ncbi:MAG: glycosyltransferase family 2 protein [Candidatus Sumerlaeota bacterium]|nr:glycosyltransferase family 2 protein [Candidatus Sumerlaeota bacterium]
MFEGKKIVVVVPAYNEEKLIGRTLTTMPSFVDSIVVVDDVSRDGTVAQVEEMAAKDPRVVLIRHTHNKGVGGAISSGYVWCRDNDVDITVVMAGDGQMDPADLPNLLAPVIEGRADYAKGNRLISGDAWNKIPKARYIGNSLLTLLTKIASGYWHVTDSQTGYTALSLKALKTLPIENIYPRYGMPNDFLVTLNIYNMRVADVPIAPVYGIGEKSGFKPLNMIVPLSGLIMRLFLRRMLQKYIIRDFHPLVLFYAFGALLLMLDFVLVVRLVILWGVMHTLPEVTAFSVLFTTAIALQTILFAMLFDMESNKDLKG